MTEPADAFCIVAFASLGQVQRVRRRLMEAGKFADMIRTPSSLMLKGCGFSLRAPMMLLADIRIAAVDVDIAIGGAFGETPDGYETIS
jgi:hypothetical protein